MIVIQEQYWTPKELAKQFRVTEETIRRLIREKQLEAIRFGGSYRISDEALQRYIEKQNKPDNENK